MIIRDDLSRDDTVTKIRKWEQRDKRITSIPGGTNLGMVGNYDAVLSASKAQWVMLADPDDVWRPGKLALSVRTMREAEKRYGTNTPIIVCSDAEVVDQDLNPIATSFWQWSRMNPRETRFPRMIVESPVLTSTMMMNRPVLDLALPLNGAASCPDWWPAMIASVFGSIVCLPDKTIQYRRHSKNDSLTPFTRQRPSVSEARKRVDRLVRQFAPQAAAFADRFHDKLSRKDLAALNAAARLTSLDSFRRRWIITRHRLWFTSPLKNAGLLLFG